MAFERFRATTDPAVAALYFGSAGALNVETAVGGLVAKLAGLEEVASKKLAEHVLPQIFGTRWALSSHEAPSLDLATLEQLVVLAYRIVRVEDDHDRANNGVYSPDERDHAEEARSAAFNKLVTTPGRAAFDAIMRLERAPQLPGPDIPSARTGARAGGSRRGRLRMGSRARHFMSSSSSSDNL